MANNKGKMIIYGNRNTTGAMAAAMGLTDKPNSFKSNKPKQNQQENTIVPDKGKTDRVAENKKTPCAASGRPNVKYNSKNSEKAIGESGKFFKKQLSHEQIKEKETRKTIGKLEEQLNLACEDYKKVGDSLFYLMTDKVSPNGNFICLSVYHEPDDPANIVTISDEGDSLCEFIYSANNKEEIRAEIMKEIGKSKWKDKIRFTVGQYTAPAALGESVVAPLRYGLEAKCRVKEVIYIKWALVDILEKIFDEDMELREACGV